MRVYDLELNEHLERLIIHSNEHYHTHAQGIGHILCKISLHTCTKKEEEKGRKTHTETKRFISI